MGKYTAWTLIASWQIMYMLCLLHLQYNLPERRKLTDCGTEERQLELTQTSF